MRPEFLLISPFSRVTPPAVEPRAGVRRAGRDEMDQAARSVRAEAMVRLLEERTEILRDRCPAAAEQLERAFAEADAA